MGRHRVYSARARGAFAPRAGQQRQQMRGGGGISETICTTRVWQHIFFETNSCYLEVFNLRDRMQNKTRIVLG